MTVFEKPTQSNLRRGCRQTAGRTVSEAARGSYDQSSEKYLLLRRFADYFRQRTELSARQNEWLTYATELRKLEHSLEGDLRKFHSLVSQIEVSTCRGEDESPRPRRHSQKASEVGSKPAQKPALPVVDKFSTAPSLGESRDQKRQSIRTPRCRLRHKFHSTNAKRLSSWQCLLQPCEAHQQTLPPVRDNQAFDEGIPAKLDTTHPPHATIPPDYSLDALQKRITPLSVGLGAQDAPTNNILPNLQQLDGNVLLKDVLTLRCYARSIAKNFPACPPAGTKLSRGNAKATDANCTEVESPQNLNRETTVSGQMAKMPEQEVCRSKHPPDQRECDLSTCQGDQTQEEEMSPPSVFSGCSTLLSNYQGSCFSKSAVFACVTDFADLLQMQHAVLDHTHRKLQLEEARVEQEVRNAVAQLHQLVCKRPTFSTTLIRTRRSTTTAGQPPREGNAWSERSSLSRLSTRSELLVESETKQSPEHTDYVSDNCTDEEEVLLQELTQAKHAYLSALPFAEGDEGGEERSTEIVKLTHKYLGELEKLHVDLENCLDGYTREADELNKQQQNLLQKAHVGTDAEVFQDQGEVVKTVGALEPRCRRQVYGVQLKTSSTSTDYAKEEVFAHCRICPAKSTLMKLFRNYECRSLAPSQKYAPVLSAAHVHSASYTLPVYRHSTLALAMPERAVNASVTTAASSLTSYSQVKVHGEKIVESTSGPASFGAFGQGWNRGKALLRYATQEFQHLISVDMQQADCTLLGKLHFIFPKASQVTLRKLIDIDKQLLLIQQRRAAALWRFSRTRDEALSRTREQLRQLMLRLKERREKQDRDAQQRRRTARFLKQLEAHRRRANEQQLAQSEAAEACAAAQNARETQRNQKEQQRRAHAKRLIAEHREAKVAVYKQQELQTAAALELEAEEREARRRRCRNLLLRRREEGLWKSRTQAQTRQYETLRQAEVIQRLLRLAAKYAVYVPADADRVQQHTCASKAREQHIRVERQEVQDLQGLGHRLVKGCTSAYFAVPHGYSMENLLSDMRLRLSTALHEAGLLRSRAGREALLELQMQRKSFLHDNA